MTDTHTAAAVRTRRLFDEDSHLWGFDATVLDATSLEDSMTEILLDATAFFPEGGGQYADPGVLAGYPVVNVKDRKGVIVHTVDTRGADCADVFRPGVQVHGEIDRDVRLVRMQNHSAEHILSGLIHRDFGFSNVGFHLGDGDVTLDFNGVLTREQLDKLEDEANRVVAANIPINAFYPSAEVLSDMTYRSKLSLTENVRIVEVGEGDGLIDRCACCAPHVSRTGEIGVIKLLDFMHYKGGVRIHMLAGSWALADYRQRYTATAHMAAAMSVKQEEVLDGFARLQEEINTLKQTITTLRAKHEATVLAGLSPTQGSLCLFEEGLEALEMRRLLNGAVSRCGRLCGVFSGNDTDGYRFVIGRGDPLLDLRAHARDINTALSARGGGSSEMLQGSSTATRAEIEHFFSEF